MWMKVPECLERRTVNELGGHSFLIIDIARVPTATVFNISICSHDVALYARRVLPDERVLTMNNAIHCVSPD